MRTALSLSLFACASLSLPIWQLSRTLAGRPAAASERTTWKLLPEASSTFRSWVVVCFWAQLISCASGTLWNLERAVEPQKNAENAENQLFTGDNQLSQQVCLRWLINCSF